MMPISKYADVRDVQLLEKVRAAFRPRRTDDLRPGAKAIIGRVLEWQAVWRICEDERPEYAGMVAFAPLLPAEECCDFAWVPECDLELVETPPAETGPVGRTARGALPRNLSP